jgi:hypothetical protein
MLEVQTDFLNHFWIQATVVAAVSEAKQLYVYNGHVQRSFLTDASVRSGVKGV